MLFRSTENLALNYNEGREFTSADTNVTSTKIAAHATQSLDGVVQDWEANQPKPGVTPDTCSESTPIADRLCWYEGTTEGAFSDRWLSRSSNGATESDLSFPADVQTDEDQALGTYYNWYTAVMGTITTSQTQVEATEDICPKGWKMSRGNTSSGSWSYLIKSVYGFISSEGTQADSRISDLLHKFPFSMPYAGGVARASGANTGRGTNGYFWSPRAGSAPFVGRLRFYNSYVDMTQNAKTASGLSIRCLTKQSN